MPAPHRDIALTKSPLRSARTIGVLAITQLIGWGTTFESLGVLGRSIAPDLGLANEMVFAGLSVMMLASAFCGPLVGRLLGRHGAAKVLAAGSVFFCVGLLVLSLANGLPLYAVAWILLGAGGAFCLSAPAYAAVVEREGTKGRRSITILMLFTGLSATIFWPLLSLGNDLIGWRTTLMVCAFLHLFVCVPLYLFALPKPIAWDTADAGVDAPPVAFTARQGKLAFLLVATATTIASFASYGVSPSLLELLRQSGATPEFALQLAAARGVIGISARAFDMLLGKRGNPFITAVTGNSFMILGFLSLIVLPSSTATLWIFIGLYGIGSAVLQVAKALLPLALFSPRDYGRQAARLSMPQNLANALAPVVFTALLDRSGALTVLVVTVLLAGSALTGILFLMHLVRQSNRLAASHSVTAR